MSSRTRCNPHAVLAFPAILLLAAAPVARGAVHLTDAAGGADGKLFGTSVRELEDLDGDGRWELLVGAPESEVAGGNKAGAVFLWLGGRNLTEAPDRVWRGVADDEFGWCVAPIGDVNDDGRPDWAVGAPARGATRPGRVYVFYGAATPAAVPAPLTIEGASANDQFGFSVSAAGDFDGDGIDDFIVGAPYADVNGANNGAAYVIYGAGGGPSNQLGQATALRGSFADDHFGWAVCDAGNFLGGNARAVAAGAPDNNTRGLDAGAVYVYEGTLGGAAPDTTIDHWISTSNGSPAGGRFGFALRNAGRWSSDSYDDLAVGAPEMTAGSSHNGRVEIVFGGAAPSAAGDRYANGANAGDRFGWSVARLGQVAGATYEDLAVGAPQRDFEASNAGRAYIWEGNSGSANLASDLTISANVPLMPGTEADDQFGWAVSSAGDFDGDGVRDLAVGAPYGNIASNATGGFCLLVDTSDQVVPTFLSRWQAAWTPEGAVRVVFALGVPVESISRLQLVRRGPGGEATVYAGPPDPAAGALALTPAGFEVLDAAAAATGGFSYVLTVTLADGSSRTLDALQGPAGTPPALPANLALGDIWPNPANPMVSIRFRADGGESLACRIYDLRGRLVRTLHTGAATGDWQTVQWDGRTEGGQAAPSGSYLVLLQAASGARARQLTLAR